MATGKRDVGSHKRLRHQLAKDVARKETEYFGSKDCFVSAIVIPGNSANYAVGKNLRKLRQSCRYANQRDLPVS